MLFRCSLRRTAGATVARKELASKQGSKEPDRLTKMRTDCRASEEKVRFILIFALPRYVKT